jgi:serine/threonine protein kinase
MLGRFRQQPHVIRLISTFERDGVQSMIFPWADANLYQHWERNLNGPSDFTTEVWISTQLYGLANAINYMHSNGVRHGDIKPENILWFQKGQSPEGHLVLSDLGLSITHDMGVAKESRILGFMATYRAPEIDMRDGIITRAQDIWSFGCVLLELTCWLLGGMELVEDFAKARINRSGDEFDGFFSREALQNGTHQFSVDRVGRVCSVNFLIQT